MKFLDLVKLKVSSGRGGPGAVSFRREKFVPRGGPDGGQGGRGGHVYFRINPRINSLLEYRYQSQLKAAHGEPGGTHNKTGAQGEDLYIDVPPGTIIKDENGLLLKDLSEVESDLYLFLEGGRGGRGNESFKTSVNQVPHQAQPGGPGHTKSIQLEIKVLADVGLVGLPNAGKSTLLSAISAARPKIADYPFTTLTPQLGSVEVGGDAYVVADLPGLVEGAAQGVGLGNQFLRHLERTRVFLHVVDGSSWSEESPEESYETIRKELVSYDERHQEELALFGGPLSERRHLVILSKADLIDERERERLISQFRAKGVETFAISAATGWNINELKVQIKRLLDKVRGYES